MTRMAPGSFRGASPLRARLSQNWPDPATIAPKPRPRYGFTIRLAMRDLHIVEGSFYGSIGFS